MSSSSQTERASRAVPATVVALIVAVLAALAVFVGPPAPARADDTIGISARPATADGATDGRTRFSYKTEPGLRIDDHFLVANTGTVAQNYTVIGTDAYNDDEGDYALLATSEQPVSIGQWVRFENGGNRIEFSLKPGESRLLPFSVEVPANATPGDHAGGLVASVVTPGEEVTLDRRVATRLYARVAGQLQPQLAISALDSEYLGDWWNPFSGNVRMYFTVRNVGNVALAANTSFGVDTWFAIPASTSSGDGLAELLPGGARNVTVDVPGVAAWLYLAPWVELAPFVDSPDPANALPVDPTSRSTFLIAVPWPLIILAALIAGGILFVRWRRQRDAQRAAEWARFTEREAERQAVEQRLVDARAGGDKGSA